MKRFVKMLILSAMLVLSLGCISTTASAAAKTSVMALKKGKTTTIKSTSKVTSSKKTVASAKKKSSTKYKITAKKAGKTTLKVYNKNGKLSQKIYLLVYTSKTMNYDTSAISLKKGSTKKVQATVPKGCTVKYSSSDKSIAKVNANGKITAVKKGTATIKAKVYYKGEKIKTYKKDVKVNAASSSGSSGSSSSSSGSGSSSKSTLQCSMSPTSLTIVKGKNQGVICSAYDPNDSSSSRDDYTYKWTSSDTSVATISKTSIYGSGDWTVSINGEKKGTATITCTVNGVASCTCKVTVTSDDKTVNGVNFDLNNFPTEVSISSSDCLSVIPESTINPGDVTYVIANGKAELLCDYTTEDLYANKSRQYTHEYYVSDWNNMIAYIETSYREDMYLKYRCEIYSQLKTGNFDVSVYYQGKLIRTCHVSVTGTSENAKNWKAWVDEIEANAWTSGMTVEEKLSAVKSYVYENFSYYGDGVMCNNGAAALLYAARDLGLTARYRFTYDSTTGNNYNYGISGQDVYYHLGMGYIGGHVCTIITIDGKEYFYEAQGHY